MLLRFGVSNFRSVREYAEFSLIASDAIKDQGSDLFEWPAGKVRVLPGIVLYGANAAGKSSVYSAVGEMRSHVLTSFSGLGATANVPQYPFALDRVSNKKPTRFDCDFIIDQTRYHYGFEFGNASFLKEWLYAFPGSYKRMLFNRDAENSAIDFGKYLKGRNKLIEELTRPNSLYLSAAAQNFHPQLTAIYSFFAQQLQGLGPTVDSRTIQNKIGKHDDPRLAPFLQLADTGISNITIRRNEPDARSRKLLENIRASLVADALDDVDIKIDDSRLETEVFFSHTGSDGELFDLPFVRESRGTRRLSYIILSALQALDSGGTIFVDELDASFHTLLSLKLLSLFMKKSTNPHGAQLLATTHDTNILCSSLLRRDQIWFAEKGRAGNTHLYPLTDIKTRNTDNIEKGYLQGRFGAVPYLGRVEDLFNVGNDEA